MSRTSITLRGRAFIEGLMLDAGTIERAGATVNETTGVPTWTKVYPVDPAVATGPMSVESYQPQEANPEVGGATVTVQRSIIKVPVGAYAPLVGDRVTLAAAALDANLVSRKFRVVSLLHKTAATAYRMGVEEVL